MEQLTHDLAAKQEQIDILIAKMAQLEAPANHSDDDDILFELPTDDTISREHGLTEIPGGIGIDSCASANVMARRMLPGYRVKPSPGSKRGQRWGSASGHTIKNEGEVLFKFMTESGAIKRGKTQVGDVQRPLAAVSEITKAKQIAFFCEGEDWLIDRRDPLAQKIIDLVQKAKLKQKIYQHKGTYRMRAWMIPGDEEPTDASDGAKRNSSPFGRPGR